MLYCNTDICEKASECKRHYSNNPESNSLSYENFMDFYEKTFTNREFKKEHLCGSEVNYGMFIQKV